MTTEHAPLDWIQLELLPLPEFEQEFKPLLLWWNPEEGRLLGENVDLVLQLIDRAIQDKFVKSVSSGSFEVTDPLKKPSELAAVLAQYFWVVPQPVKSPGPMDSSSEDDGEHSLQ
ncbi:hypothetical protein [Thiomicrorhabdus sp.]|uniref:hypothetical protein n=1 Tax=Thiomicrorhabdus sp. TaxID=2039724 RepID=UPI003561C922